MTVGANYRPGARWSLGWLWTFHSGWPTTAVAAEAMPGPDGGWDVIHTIGPFYAERLSDYHRMDLRASRAIKLRKGWLTVFMDIQNLYDRGNVRGLEIDDEWWVQTADDRIVAIWPDAEWLGIIPSFGVSWGVLAGHSRGRGRPIFLAGRAPSCKPH